MQLESETGKVYLNYLAKNVNIVAGGTGTVEVLVDGVVVDTVMTSEERLYEVVAGEIAGQHDLELRVTGKGFQLYTFTFG